MGNGKLKVETSEKVLIKGNYAIAQAAVNAGCQCYFGYPITPQTEIGEYLSGKMQELGRGYVCAESELAAINMVMGAVSTGVKAMTSSSMYIFRLLLVLPFIIYSLIFVLNKEYFQPLFNTTIGLLILSFIIILYVLYIIIVNKIMKVDV